MMSPLYKIYDEGLALLTDFSERRVNHGETLLFTPFLHGLGWEEPVNHRETRCLHPE